MGQESKKTSAVRSDIFYREYLSGNIIDIGGGNDPVTKTAEVFDLDNGDAQHILEYKEPNSYDSVYSSHCLEHMKDVPLAIFQWWELLKPKGFMIIVVPHEDLYEQGIWPSIFNKGHHATFRLKSKKSWSYVSFDIHALIKSLPNSKILEYEIHDYNYDYSLCKKKFGKVGHLIHRWQFKKNTIKRFFSKILYPLLHTKLFEARQTGKVIDQTASGALAQIQIVAQKNESIF